MNAEKTYRIAVVNSHPIQYFAPMYAYLTRHGNMEVTALYCSDFSLRGGVDPGFKQQVAWDVDLLSGYPSIFLGTRSGQRTPGGFFSLICPEIWKEVKRGQYDAIWLHGYAYAAYVLAFLAAKRYGIPVLVRSETHLGLTRSGWRRRLRDGILRIVYRFVDGFLAIGSANADYYRSLGVPEYKIFQVPYTVDNERFMAAVQSARDKRSDIRQKYGLPTNFSVVLYASKFLQRKHPDDVIAAIAALNTQGINVTLLMVGTGEMEADLRTQVAQSGLKNVIFAGFANQTELPQIYVASDVFVLPSENEPWGLIVNEVMCAGLPVVVADEVGCVPDLVMDGINGAHMRAGDVNSLTKALRQILADQTTRERMGKASLARIQNWSYEQCLHGVQSALSYLTTNPNERKNKC